MKPSNMYKLSVKQWNPFVGCLYSCSYCKPSFQAQLKRWGKSHCRLCYEYKPHHHSERLDISLPRTKYLQFIFCCSNGDIAFCPTFELYRILHRIKREPDKNFLIQSKDPSTFSRVKFPSNVILATTIETNIDDIATRISKAPPPSKRLQDFLKIDHQLKMVTIEPVMNFDLKVMLDWMQQINPCMIWIGYDSKATKIPEPPLWFVKKLHWELSKAGYIVVLKTIRKAWWQA